MRDHLPEYLSEFFGTAIMMIVGIGAIALIWGDGSPMRAVEMPVGLRRLLTGICSPVEERWSLYPLSDSAAAVT